MTDVLIASLATLWLGVGIGYWLGTRPARPVQSEQARQDEIERRLTGKPKPKHRAAPEPARIRAARMARSNRWSS